METNRSSLVPQISLVPSVSGPELHFASVVADAHNDLLMGVAGRPVPRWPEFFREQWLPQLRAGNVGLQVLPVFVETRHSAETALRHTMRAIECAHRIAESSPDEVALCVTGAEIEEALASDRIALVLALESMPGIDHDVEILWTLHRLGVRIASLTHVGRTAFADGSGEDATNSGLTSTGARAVAEMEQMGMLLDVSHLGASGVEHVLEIATRPLIATHSSARAMHDHHRNLSDVQLRGIAGTGGIVCVNFFAPFLHPTDHSLPRLVDHLEHIVGLIGVQHVGLGPDFVEEVIADTTPRCCEEDLAEDAYIPGLEGPAGLPMVTDALLKRGWSVTDIQAVLGTNLRDFLVANLP